MYCESDQASLCWDCDSKVHGANFLVTKHTRTLLCYDCRSLTPWTCSGPKLVPTISICENCVRCSSRNGGEEGILCNSDDERDDDEEEEEEKDEENQVVPRVTVSPPPVSRCFRGGENYCSNINSSSSEQGNSRRTRRFESDS